MDKIQIEQVICKMDEWLVAQQAHFEQLAMENVNYRHESDNGKAFAFRQCKEHLRSLIDRA